MRELKFRAWDKEKKVMLDMVDTIGFYHGGIHFSDGCTTEGWATVNDEFKDKNKATIELMQYTGLHDKQGKEIYEGDILECMVMVDENIDYWSSKPLQYVIIWNDHANTGWDFIDRAGYIKGHRYLTPLPFDLNSHWEIIGNIYENPKLLEQVSGVDVKDGR